MKKIILLSALVALIASCTPPKEQKVKVDQAEVDTVQSPVTKGSIDAFELKRSN